MSSTSHARLGLALPALGLLFVAPSFAQCWDQHLSGEPADTNLDGGLAVGPGRIAFGRPRFDPTNSPAISDIVHVYEGAPGSFVEAATLVSTINPGISASFGSALDFSGDWLAIGDPAAPGPGGVQGAVHMYLRGPAGWALDSVLQPPAGLFQSVGGFGVALDLDGDLLAVGAPSSTSSATALEDGLAFVFELGANGWTLVQSITNPTLAMFGSFGRSVALSNFSLAVGSPNEPVPGGTPFNGGAAGAVQIFLRGANGQFVLDTTLRAPTPTPFAQLGWSVAHATGLVVAGAPGETVNGEAGAGRAHVFEQINIGWIPAAALSQPGVHVAHRFGDDVSIAGISVFVTAEGSASARRYERIQGTWTLEHAYTTNAGVAWPIVMPVRARALGSMVVVTDPLGATVFPFQPLASVAVGCPAVAPPQVSPFGPPPPVYLDVRSALSLSEPIVEFRVFGGSAVGNGILFYGFQAASTPLGAARLCVGGTLARAATASSSPGMFQTLVPLSTSTSPVASGPSAILPGAETHFQYWFRLTSGGSHLTNSLVIEFCP